MAGLPKWTLLALTLASCRTRPSGDLVVTPSSVAPPQLLSDMGGERREAVHAPVVEISGFDLAGAKSCLPLESARRCIERDDAIKGACAAKQGDLLRCEDCTPLCSLAIGAP